MTSVSSGLLGKTLSHSYSPKIHAAFGDYPYALFEKTEEEIPAFFREAPFTGINVTIPYKRAVLPYMAELSEVAGTLGSVNTVVKRPDGTLYGDNTDVYGFLETLRRSGIPVAGKKALVLGSGGASAAVSYALKAKGARVVVISRSGEDNYTNLERHRDARILVNATPLGMYPGNGLSPLSLTAFPALEGVFDLIYNPARTALLMEAEQLGIPAVSGLFMLVSQAARSSESFTGTPVGAETVARVARDLAREMENIVLVGMPGSGKTCVGKELGQITGRPVLDSDEEVRTMTGKTPAQLIETEGEDAFRRAETEVLAELGKRSGIILSTGGGAVTREENYPLLHGNGKIVWLRRDIALLDRKDRPLSGDLEALYKVREPLYRRFSDVIIDNDCPADETARRILEAL